MATTNETAIAVIGLSCRFPGARDPAAFWENLIEGRESITFFSQAELVAAGLDRALSEHQAYVRARGVLDGIECFDAAAFDMTPAEAAMTDPQHRLFLECAWEAMEDGGYDGSRFRGPIGVYAGAGANSYLRDHVLPLTAKGDMAGLYQAMQANEKDFLATRTAYKLHLTGPAITVQTACSTSLVAVHCACQAIINGECDMALAGGVSIFLPQLSGYLYQEGMILSPDGHCRAFDAAANGTVMGSGAGVVLLKRLDEAVRDHDFIHGVIRGSAVNNDGANKVGFAAPGVEGQVRVIREALAVSGVEPAAIGYVETHGTATPMGDPVEIEALGRAFGKAPKGRGACLIGSVKTNIGHCDAAAGIAGLIKTLLALRHGRIPPSLHYQNPNPGIDFATTPFRVCTAPTAWETAGGPRMAGVSSFGMGGTNAHLIVQEAPPRGKGAARRGLCLLPLSGKSASAVAKAAGRLARHIDSHPQNELADIAFTLQVGRRPFNHRHFVVAGTRGEAEAALAALSAADRTLIGTLSGARSPAITFMFPGQGSQYVGMGRELQATEKVFRAALDECAAILTPLLGKDPRLYLTTSDESLAAELRQTAIAQPVLFSVEYAYAMLLGDWGIRPQSVIGHSLGEYVAACLAGVFTLPDALKLVAARGALMQRQPKGTMVAVSRSAAELTPFLSPDVSLAAVNGASCTLSGPAPAIAELIKRFAADGITHAVLQTSHAFHSAMFDAAMEEFAAIVAAIPRRAPRMPLISNLTGGPLADREAMDPWYWARHLRHTVRFGEGLEALLTEPHRLLVEVGPGRTLTNLALVGRTLGAGQGVVGVGSHPRDPRGATHALWSAVGEMWTYGAPVDWQAVAAAEGAGRLPLPTYPFARQVHWLEPAPAPSEAVAAPRLPPAEGWLYTPAWRRLPLLDRATPATAEGRWLLIASPGPLTAAIVHALEGRGCRPTVVTPAATFRALSSQEFWAEVTDPEQLDRLFKAVGGAGPLHLVYLSSLQATDPAAALPEQALRFTIALVKAIGQGGLEGPVFVDLLCHGVHDLSGEEELVPANAALLAATHSMSREYPALRCRCLDCGLAGTGAWSGPRLATLVAELLNPERHAPIALRGGYRWQEHYEPLPPLAMATGLRRHGTYLVTGGLGDIGLALADALARHCQANLVLTRRTPFPAPDLWPAWLAEHGEDTVTSGLIRRLQAVQQQGATVLTCAADVGSRAEMGAVIEQAERVFGRIHGCIHAAGLTGAKALAPYGELSVEKFSQCLAPKVEGYLILRELLRDRELDFMIAMSSLAAILGGAGMGAYGGANAVMAARIAADNRSGGQWLCVDWDGWRFTESSPDLAGESDPLGFAIPAAMGAEQLLRLTQKGPGERLAVSVTELNERWPRPARRPGGQVVAAQEAVGHDHAAHSLETPEEELVAGIWRGVLGTPSLNRQDSFFALGGSSLQLTQVHSRLREALGLDFPLRALFEAPRLADMADLVRRYRGLSTEESPAARQEMEF